MKKNYIHLSRSEMHFPTKDIEIMDVFYINIRWLLQLIVSLSESAVLQDSR